MKNYKYSILTLLTATLLLFTGCRDEFAKLNRNPSDITEADPGFLFAQLATGLEPYWYQYWFYNGDAFLRLTQHAAPAGGVRYATFTDGINAPGVRYGILKAANELKFVRSTMEAEESDKFAYYAAFMDVLCIYIGILDTDLIGDIPYTEASQASHGGTLTPKYDKVSDLYTLWLSQLDEDINVLTTATNQATDPKEDPIYAADPSKWAKLANTLKLKIAARLINVDRQRAIGIAETVARSTVGIPDGLDDDFVYNRHANDYNFGDNVLQSTVGSQTMVDFLVKNLDPRVRFIFAKNDWNAKVVQAFFNRHREDDVPQYIMDNLEYTFEQTDTAYQFKAWKGAGEPWVRYYGVPLDMNAGGQAKFGDWFNYSTQCKLENNNIYLPFSTYQLEMLQPARDYTIPTDPGDGVIQDKEDYPFWGMYMSSAEINLLLAEFELLGANLPLSAEEYFKKGVRLSVENYDRLAKLNNIPYYGTTYDYDPNEESIELKDGEVETLLKQADYTLTGDKASDLEKVYLQQFINYTFQPGDLWVTCLRSGIPKIGSTLFPRMAYDGDMAVDKLPRRMNLAAPSPTDLMYSIIEQSYKDQGYTAGSGNFLNAERTWQDKQNPQWGAGPNM
jgi:hypothetical protein